MVMRRTAKERIHRAMKTLASWCREHRHDAMREQWKQLCSKLRGHYRYFGVTFNFKPMQWFWHLTCRLWHKWLNRRSQRRTLNWEKMNRLLERWPLPKPRIYHPLFPLPQAANP